jgi:hypothetical protein
MGYGVWTVEVDLIRMIEESVGDDENWDMRIYDRFKMMLYSIQSSARL